MAKMVKGSKDVAGAGGGIIGGWSGGAAGERLVQFDSPVEAALIARLANISCSSYADDALSQSVRRTALTRLAEIAQLITPLLEGKTAPTPSTLMQATDGATMDAKDVAVAVKWGLLPECSTTDNELAEGLEPVYGLTPDGSPYWRSHVKWFRWFASGDVALLLVLLMLRELH